MKSLFTLFFCILFALSSKSQVSWDFEGSLLSAQISPNSAADGITGSNASLAGVSATSFPAGNGSLVAYSGDGGWTTSTSIDLTDYLEVCMTSGTTPLTVTTLSFDERRSGTGVRAFEVRSSSDSYGSALFSGVIPDNTSFRTQSSSSLGISLPASTQLCFRIYGYNSENAGSGAWRFDNVRISGTSPLPITLKEFKGVVLGASTLLSFSTATELNNSHFVIERSADGRAFSEIGQVRGAGTTRVPQSYTFTDERPLQGVNYYRLRQVDFDGGESFSSVVSVVFGKRTGITLAPSPATDRVRIQLDEATANDGLWQVYDNTGRQVLSGAWEAESADYELDVNTLPEGMYTFRLVVGAQVQVKQFRKM